MTDCYESRVSFSLKGETLKLMRDLETRVSLLAGVPLETLPPLGDDPYYDGGCTLSRGELEEWVGRIDAMARALEERKEAE